MFSRAVATWAAVIPRLDSEQLAYSLPIQMDVTLRSLRACDPQVPVMLDEDLSLYAGRLQHDAQNNPVPNSALYPLCMRCGDLQGQLLKIKSTRRLLTRKHAIAAKMVRRKHLMRRFSVWPLSTSDGQKILYLSTIWK